MEGDETCPNDKFSNSKFGKSMKEQMWQLNSLLVVNAILVVVMVGIVTYGRRYRHRPFTRFLYDVAATLFLPIMSYAVSLMSNMDENYWYSLAFKSTILVVRCISSGLKLFVIIWAGLLQVIAINVSTIVAGDDREGRNVGPPILLLVQATWVSYLAFYNAEGPYQKFGLKYILLLLTNREGYFLFLPLVVIFVKMIFKFYAFYKARRSFALGRNPRLVVGYMKQLQDESQRSEHAPPPLLVKGEETVRVERKPHGYSFTQMSDQGGRTQGMHSKLVTIDKVWQLDDMLLGSTATTQLKDVCLSFALFKLLRCRFARYTIAETGFHKVSNFFWHVLLKDGNDQRVLGVIADELSFLYDYYHSSLPTFYPHGWLPVLMSSFISLLSIGVCLYSVAVLFLLSEISGHAQVWCSVYCIGRHGNITYTSTRHAYKFGRVYFDILPMYLLVVLVMLTEAREIASYIFSNWTKVTLSCHFVNHTSWQRSPMLRKWVGYVLQCRCKLLKHWEDKMNQCSILVLHPRKTPLPLLLGRLTPVPDQKKKIPRAVKISIVNAVRSYHEGSRSLQLLVGDNLLWSFNAAKGIADNMLVCHIATSILEVRSRQPLPDSDHKIAATHLSRYCIYLVACCPELLPDDDGWCRNLYKTVKKEADSILTSGIAVSTPEAEYQQMVELLTTGSSKHEVLMNGLQLGKRLVDQLEPEGGEETVWKAVARYWSDMLLHIAPSENIDGHVEAIARGGELITLLWALLTHLGIVSRPDDDTAGTSASGATV